MDCLKIASVSREEVGRAPRVEVGTASSLDCLEGPALAHHDLCLS